MSSYDGNHRPWRTSDCIHTHSRKRRRRRERKAQHHKKFFSIVSCWAKRDNKSTGVRPSQQCVLMLPNGLYLLLCIANGTTFCHRLRGQVLRGAIQRLRLHGVPQRGLLPHRPRRPGPLLLPNGLRRTPLRGGADRLRFIPLRPRHLCGPEPRLPLLLSAR